MKNRKIIGIVAIVIGVLLATSLIGLNIVQVKQTSAIYITSKNINAGAQITTDDIEKRVILTKDKQSDYITDPNTIVGSYATVDLVANDIITNSKISTTAISTDNQFLSIPSGKQAISFSVSGGADSLSNKLKVGDIIRIYSYDKQKDNVISYDSLKYVRVANITSSGYQDVEGNGNDGTGKNSSNDNTDDSSSYSTITVIVYTQQVDDLIRIQKNGGAYVTLISRGNDQVAEQLLKEQENLLKKGD